MSAEEQRRIPLVDLRRVVLYGLCRRPHPMHDRLTRHPCSSTSYRDDVHFAGCPQAAYSRAGVTMVWR